MMRRQALWLRWKLIQLLSLHGTSFSPKCQWNKPHHYACSWTTGFDSPNLLHIGFQTASHAVFYGGGFSCWGRSPERFPVFLAKPVMWGRYGFWNAAFCSKCRFLMWLYLLYMLTLWIHYFFYYFGWSESTAWGKRCRRAPEHHISWSVVKGAEEAKQKGDYCSENHNVGFGAACVCEHVIQPISTYFFFLAVH